MAQWEKESPSVEPWKLRSAAKAPEQTTPKDVIKLVDSLFIVNDRDKKNKSAEHNSHSLSASRI